MTGVLQAACQVGIRNGRTPPTVAEFAVSVRVAKLIDYQSPIKPMVSKWKIDMKNSLSILGGVIKQISVMNKRMASKGMEAESSRQTQPKNIPATEPGEVIFDEAAPADPVEVRALLAKLDGNYKDAFILLESLLSSDDPAVKARAQYGLAVMYQHGHYAKVDLERAFGLYEKSAKAGYKLAQTALGECYVRGFGAPVDHKQGVDWYLKAVKKGDPGAMMGMGTLYLSGEMYEDAAQWYKLAADRGEKEACYDFAHIYLTGRISPPDLDTAREYLKLGAELDDVKCAMALGTIYQTGHGVDIDLYEAAKYYGMAAKLGDLEGAFELGLICKSGEIEKDLELSAKLITLAAEGGYANAQVEIGVMLLEGKEVLQDYEMALYWLTTAAKRRDPWAFHYLGVMAESGKGGEVDFVEAHKWYNLAASHGNSHSQERRDVLTAKMRSEDVAAAQGRARAWV